MDQFSLSSKLDLSLFIEKENYKRIFVICGKRSFGLSGAENIFSSIGSAEMLTPIIDNYSIKFGSSGE